MLVYLNGRLVPEDEARISVFDHGFLYGDGIYETLRAYDGRLFMLERHLERLEHSAKAISLSLPMPIEKIGEALNDTLKKNSLTNAYVRLHISRGPGEIGLDPALCPEPTTVIAVRAFKDYPQEYFERGVSVAVVKIRRNHPLALDPSVKATNFLNNILAKIEAKKSGAFEAVMLNWEGYVAEGTISNIFIVSKGVVITPSLGVGILEGVTRGLVLELAKREGIRAKETAFLPKKLYDADECFITNTTMEVMPVTIADGRRIGSGKPGPLTAAMRMAYKREVKNV